MGWAATASSISAASSRPLTADLPHAERARRVLQRHRQHLPIELFHLAARLLARCSAARFSLHEPSWRCNPLPKGSATRAMTSFNHSGRLTAIACSDTRANHLASSHRQSGEWVSMIQTCPKLRQDAYDVSMVKTKSSWLINAAVSAMSFSSAGRQVVGTPKRTTAVSRCSGPNSPRDVLERRQLAGSIDRRNACTAFSPPPRRCRRQAGMLTQQCRPPIGLLRIDLEVR